MTTVRSVRWRCGDCGLGHDPAGVTYTCPACDGLLDGEYDYASLIAGSGRAGSGAPGIDPGLPGMWRYSPVLPARQPADGAPAGQTPLIPSARLARAAGVRRVWVKDEGRNPSGSLKDRASSLVVAHALAAGMSSICTASSGNAGVALAAAAAPTPLEVTVFVPPRTPAAKLAQLWAYGARVVRADGGYEQAVRASRLAAELHGWYCRNTAFNPFTTQGKKTVALEIIEQLGLRSPDAIIVPAGDGNILAGVYRGLADAMALGWTDRMPRLIAVQSSAANPIERAWARGEPAVVPMQASSRADSISVGSPADGARALRALASTGGAAFAVNDADLGQAIRDLASAAGVFAEPAAAAAMLGLRAAVAAGALGAADEVVLISTGSGLKDTSAAAGAARPAEVIEAGLDDARLADAIRAVGASA